MNQPALKGNQLLEELQFFVKKQHAEIVYRKCMTAKRYKWAASISHKYGLKDPSKDDAVIAFGLALMQS